MDQKDIDAIVTGVAEALSGPITSLATIAESLRPAEPEEVTAPDMAEVTESAVAAGLPKPARARVVAAVAAGTTVEEAIAAEKTYMESVLAESGVQTVVVEGRVTTSEPQSLNEEFAKLDIFTKNKEH